ncbi:hypothetical protein TNCV_3895971 [Trichonephila clavipes]|nr:hypothetical protein TNCV_3895971 [Trichonephila clavipes]
MRCYWIHVSVASCTHWWHFEQCTLHFWCVTTHNSTIYSSPVPACCRYCTDLPRYGKFRLLPYPARSQDLSPIENVWSMAAEQLAHHHTPVTTAYELWHHVEAAWASVPVHTIQSLTQCIGG